MKRDHRRMATFLTELKNEPSNDRLEILAGVMFRQFGGMQGFVAAWGDYYQHAMEQGGFAAYRCFATVIRLLKYCEETRPDPDELSDEELEHELSESVERWVSEHPEVAVAAADQIGWTVIPPDEGEVGDRCGAMAEEEWQGGQSPRRGPSAMP